LVDLSQYLPILIFLGIALALSSAFVFLPMGVSRLTGTYNPNAEKLNRVRMRLPRVRGPAQPVRRPVLSGRDPVHHLRSGSGVPVSWAVSLKEPGWAGCSR
jgi:NADH-quinone oxidoreductase subunit A